MGERWQKYEGSDFICWLVHPLGAVLAAGAAGGDSVSVGLGFIFAFAPGGHHDGGGIRFCSRFAVFTSPPAGVEKTRAPRGIKRE